MKPGFIDVITYGNPPTEIPRPDGHTSGRRLRAGASGSRSPQNPLTARVIVNRLWQHHFGRGIVATLDNFGKMGEPPTHPELLDWLAVEFMNRGWSIKQINRLMMTSEAYQMASAFERRRRRDERSGESVPVALPPAAPRRGDRARQHAGGRRQHQPGDRRPADLPVHAEGASSTGQYRGNWENTPDGPAAWRRGVYVYQRRVAAVSDVRHVRSSRT